MKKQKFLSKRKLVKTTTISTTLLIAVTLILSSIAIAAPSNNVSKNEMKINSNAADINTAANPFIAATTYSPTDDPWDLLFSFDLTAASGAAGNAGSEMDDDGNFYSTRWAANLIHQYDTSGTMIKEFSIAGVTGLRDLAYDGTNFYGGAAAGTIWEMDFDSETLVSTITGSFQSRAIAYNDDDETFYCSNFADPVWEVDMTGAIVDTWSFASVTSTYGFAYDNVGTDPYLWVFDQTASNGIIYQWDLTAGAFTGFTYDVSADFPTTDGIAGGLFLTNAYDPSLWTLGGLLQGVPDMMFVYELCDAGPAPNVHDVGVKSIDVPTSGPAGVFTPQVTVRNYGNFSETDVPVNLKITKMASPVIALSEDFEDLTPGYYIFPPTGWTIQNTSDSTWFKYSTGYARCSEDNYGAQDEWLITETFDCSALTTVGISMYLYMAAPNDDYVEILGSTDNGVTWDNMIINITATMSSGLRSYDITSWAAGESGVKIAWRWVSSASLTGSDYFYFRQFKIGSPTYVTSGVSEDFDGTWGPYGDNPPADWTILDFGSESPPVWNNNDWHNYYYSTFASNCARAYYSPYESMDEWLITPTIDCSALTDVDLRFRQYLYFYATYPGYGIIEGSIDNGTTWTEPIANYTATQATGYYSFDLSSWAAGESLVKLRFRYLAPGAQGRYWYIDDVMAGDIVDEIVLFENYWFNDWMPTNWGPNGWMDEEVTGTTDYDPNVWRDMAAGYLTTPTGVTPYDGTYCAIYDTGLLSPNGASARLYTPALDLASYGGSIITLKFMMYDSNYGSTYNDKLDVQVSTDGSTWTTVDSFTGYDAANPGWVQKTVDLSAYSAETVFHLGLVGVDGLPSGYRDIIIDDVTIEIPGIIVEVDETVLVDIPVGSDSEVVVNFSEWTPDDWQVSEGTDIEYILEACTDLNTTAMVSFYNADFSTGAIPGDWNVIDGGTTNDTWYCDPANPGWGAICNSDAAGSGVTMDEQLVSDPIDCSGKSEVVMEYRHRFHGGSGSWTNEGNVSVSIDGGVSWTLVMHYPPGSGDLGVQTETIDISSIAANESDVRVKFHFKDYGQYGYLWQVYWMDFLETVGFEDADRTNDCKDKTITLNYPYLHDIELVSIDAPTGGIAQTLLPVEVTLKNVGQHTECCYLTNVQIGEADIEGLYTNFEANDGGFTVTGGTWQWGTPTSGPSAAHSGTKLWATNLAGNYPAGLCSLETSTVSVPVGEDLSFWHWYDTEVSYDGGNVKISTDSGSSWTVITPIGGYTGTANTANPLSGEPIFCGHGQKYWEEETFDLAAYDGMAVSFRFDFGADGSVFYPGWYIDDVHLGSGNATVIVEYDEDICTLVLEPGEEAQLTFPDWTPDALAAGISGDFIYRVMANAYVLGDTNPANNGAFSDIVLEYFHDVGVKEITSPAIGGKQPTWIQYSDETPENALGLTSAPNIITEAIKLTPAELGTYTNHEITKVRVYKGYPGYTFEHDYEVWMYTGAQPTDPDDGTIVATGTSPLSNGWFEIDTDDYAFAPTDNVWIGINWEHPAVSTFPIGLDDSVYIAGQSSWFTYDLGTGWNPWLEYGPYTMMLGAGVEEGGSGPGAPTPEIWMPVGSDSIDTIVENLGTFEETGLTCYAEILEFITNETSGALVWDANVTGIDLDPLGGEESVAFGSYGFPIQGVYGLYLDLPLGNDDFTGNNEMVLGIGVDDTAPTSGHTVSPSSPDGDNDWYVSDVTVSFTADDGTEVWQSGLDYIEYKVNGGSPITGDSVTLTDDGTHDVEYRSVDNVGNVEDWNLVPTISIDQTAPEVDLKWEASGGNVIFTAFCSDATSGMNRVEFFLNDVYAITDDADPYEWIVEWSSALETVWFKSIAYDAAGNSAFDELYGGDAVSQMQSQATPVVRQRQTNSL